MIGTCLPDLVFTTVAGTPLVSMHVIDDASALLAMAFGCTHMNDDVKSVMRMLSFNLNQYLYLYCIRNSLHLQVYVQGWFIAIQRLYPFCFGFLLRIPLS